MYLHLGEDTVVCDKDIIGIFDIENTSVSKHTKEFLNAAGKGSRTFNVSYEMPKSFVICCDKKGKETVYISQISASTLRKRSESDISVANERWSNNG
ncbi:MAG: extracellular matrix regulator RemB [Oscillospiraceae bacterium]